MHVSFLLIFAGDEHMPANIGLLDQRQVLLWVKENIEGRQDEQQFLK